MATKRSLLEAKKKRQRTERRDAFARNTSKPAKRGTGRSTTVETPLHLRVRGLDVDDALREYVGKRVGFKFGKFALDISRISVRFEGLSGSKGEPMRECRLKVVLHQSGPILGSARRKSPQTAFDAAADATERAVRKELDRLRSAKKRRSR